MHSKALKQKNNDHWQERANERGDYDIEDPAIKAALLQFMKEELKQGESCVRFS